MASDTCPSIVGRSINGHRPSFGIIDNLICRDFGSTPGDTYCLIYNGYFQKLDLKGFLTAPTPRPSIGQPSMDGH